jgi:hypothetical protein
MLAMEITIRIFKMLSVVKDNGMTAMSDLNSFCFTAMILLITDSHLMVENL